MKIELVIFDCDGVLVDSEMLSARVLTEMLAENGIDMTWQTFCEDFLGRSFGAASAKFLLRHAVRLPDDFERQYRTRLLAEMSISLQPIPGVIELLESLTCKYALATSSSPARLETSLAVTGLTAYFQGRSFTASEVPHGKPAPDLFLHTARMNNVNPSNALVIEDSDMGLCAGAAAGMEVWHFTGGSHFAQAIKPKVVSKAHLSFASMSELHEALRKRGLSR